VKIIEKFAADLCRTLKGVEKFIVKIKKSQFYEIRKTINTFVAVENF
jgi:hypothetical protein